jgi:peptidoglycan/LPS O-acetylase OafA/YrhL
MSVILNDTATWALILGLLTPFAQSIVQRPEWSATVRVIIAIAAALVIGLVTVIANGDFNTGNWFATAGVVLAAAQTAYALVYKPTGLAKVIEFKTSRKPVQYREVPDDEAA